MSKSMTKFAILLFLLAAPVLLMAGSKNTDDHTLAAQIEQRLSGIPNTVIIVVDETTKTAFLRGTVSTQADMDRIMELVHSVNGVRVIGSNLTVLDESPVITRDDDTVENVPLNTAPPEEDTTISTTTVITDSSLRAAVEEAIKSEGIKGQSMIKVGTENGVVTLTGTALSEAHADRIVALAQSVPGVVGVQTNIQLRDQKRVYKVKPSHDRDKEGREVGEGESRADDDDDR